MAAMTAMGEQLPPELMPAYKAALLLACSASTLKRLASQGRLRQFSHPGRSGYFYAREDVDRERARFVQVMHAETDE